MRSTLVSMAQDFGTLLASPSWRDAVTSWVQAECQAHGIELTGPLTQYRLRPWSAHVTFASDAGVLWFKASCAALAYEPLLQQELAHLAAGAVENPLAIDAERAWMLTFDHGAPLGKQPADQSADWLATVLEVIELQQRVMAHRERLLATGLPDCAPETVVARFDRLHVLLRQLPEGHPSRVNEVDSAKLTDVRDLIESAVQVLLAGPLGSSWQHGDVHLGNVFDADDRLRLFDFGDSQWAHVLESLVVPYSILSGQHPGWWQQIREACRQAWDLNNHQFDELWQAVLRTQAVNRASTWHALTETMSPGAHSEWAFLARHHLMRSANV